MKIANDAIEPFRFDGPRATNCGAFRIPCGGKMLLVVASDGIGWDHVSVSVRHRCPTWEEMCFVKDLFFDAEECVMQLHPPHSEYVNNHPTCLHLWRPQSAQQIQDVRDSWGRDWLYGDIESPGDIPRPPEVLVGVKEVGLIA